MCGCFILGPNTNNRSNCSELLSVGTPQQNLAFCMDLSQLWEGCLVLGADSKMKNSCDHPVSVRLGYCSFLSFISGAIGRTYINSRPLTSSYCMLQVVPA